MTNFFIYLERNSLVEEEIIHLLVDHIVCLKMIPLGSEHDRRNSVSKNVHLLQPFKKVTKIK
jgi:hypothetical protein